MQRGGQFHNESGLVQAISLDKLDDCKLFSVGFDHPNGETILKFFRFNPAELSAIDFYGSSKEKSP